MLRNGSTIGLVQGLCPRDVVVRGGYNRFRSNRQGPSCSNQLRPVLRLSAARPLLPQMGNIVLKSKRARRDPEALFGEFGDGDLVMVGAALPPAT